MNTRQKTPFTPDYTKLKGRLVISIYENSNTCELQALSDIYKLTYQEVLGVLESIKYSLWNEQIRVNRAALKKHNIKPDAQASDTTGDAQSPKS